MRGKKEITIPDTGTDLVLNIRGQQYTICPTAGDVLRLQSALEALPTEDTLSLEAQAEIADALLSHLSGEHADYFKTLPVQQQTAIVGELWNWYTDQGEPTEDEAAPFAGPSASRGTPASASVQSSVGGQTTSESLNGLVPLSELPRTSGT